MTRKTTTTFVKAIVTALLLTTSLSANICSNGCLSCAKIGRCYQCYNRKWQNYVCLQDTAPITENCQVGISAENGRGDDCGTCAEGYLKNLSNEPNTCDPSPIKNCVISNWFKNIKQCYVCGNGFYASNDLTQCLSVTQAKVSVPHCLWGRLAGKVALCYKCKPGFMSLNGQRCIQQTLTGCLRTDKSGVRCHLCDGANAFYDLNADGKCYKGTPLPGVGEEIIENREERFVSDI